MKGRFVSLDPLHAQTDTARAAVLEAGAEYLLTAKDNQPSVHQTIEQLLPAPKADFPLVGSQRPPNSAPWITTRAVW